MSVSVYIHTLWLPERLGVDERGRLIQILSKPEQGELTKISHPVSNMEYLLGHVMLRIKMAKSLGVKPHELPLKFGRKQKPVWETQTSEHQHYLSLSHSHGLVATAFANVPLGVDVEKIRTQSHGRQVAKKQFHPLEQAALMHYCGSDFDHKFFAYWSLKEALFKAGDFNQADVAKRTEFVFNAGGIKCNFHFSTSPDVHTKDWQFMLEQLSNNYLLALAVNMGGKIEVIKKEVTLEELLK